MSDMSEQQMETRLKDVEDELERLAAKAADNGDLDDKDEKYHAELVDEALKLDRDVRAIKRERALARVQKSKVLAAAKKGHSESPQRDLDDDPIGEPESAVNRGGFRNPWDLSELRTFNRSQESITEELRSRALSAVEKMTGTNDARRQAMTDIIERFDDDEGSLSKQALMTSDANYVKAFGKLARAQGNTAVLEPEEMAALRTGLSLTNNKGGYLVPFQLDPSVIITSDGSLNQIRQVARQVVATGDVWHGVSAGEVQFTFGPEKTVATDNSPTFAQPTVDVRKAQAFVPITIEALADAQNITQEIGRLLAFGKDTSEATVFITGVAGSDQPVGINTAAALSSTVEVGTDGAFSVDSLYALDGALPERFQARATWLAHRRQYNRTRTFTGAGVWEESLQPGNPALLLGRPVIRAEAMPGTVEENDRIMIYGDFEHYVIADRIGMTVELIPHLFSQAVAGTAHGFPTGQRGWYAYYRVGANVVHEGAFRVLKVTEESTG